MAWQTMEILLLPYTRWLMSLLCRSCEFHSCRRVEETVDDWPRMLVIMAGMNQKESYAARRPRSLPTPSAACIWLVLRVTSFHAVFLSVVGLIKMLGILVGMD